MELDNNPTPATVRPKDASLARGITIGLLVIVLLILVCALYLWGALLSKQVAEPIQLTTPINNEPETPRADADIQILKTVSDSDDMAAIEADLSSTNVNELDKELPLIENDLAQ